MDKASLPNPMLSRADTPRVSVVMPVHNALPFLDAAVRSIVCQTFSDFEFVILDDASTDGSTERLRYWATQDSRIRLLEAKQKLGPALSSDRVAREASAPIVARMDADDVSYPDRLERQLEVLSRHLDVGVVGSLGDVIDSRGHTVRGRDPWRLKRASWFVPFAHGTLMYRRTLFDQVGGYRKACVYWEDQDLIARMRIVSKVLVIPRALYQTRQWTKNTRLISEPDRLEQAMDLGYRAVARLEQGRDYDDLLHIDAKPTKVDPRVFISLGSMGLWAGQNPRMLRRLLRRGQLSFDMRSFTALVWAVWGSISPGSLRRFLWLLLQIRNTLASGTVPTNEPVPWSPASRNANPRRRTDSRGAAV